jgi:hypothetical protein
MAAGSAGGFINFSRRESFKSYKIHQVPPKLQREVEMISSRLIFCSDCIFSIFGSTICSVDVSSVIGLKRLVSNFLIRLSISMP